MPDASEVAAERIRAVYERVAPTYDRCEWVTERLLLRRLRRDLLSRLRCGRQCRVLEVGIGTGANLPFYPPAAVIHGIDLSRPMLERALARTHRLGRQLTVETTDGEHLAFPDRSFDAVLSTLTLCTTPDPRQLLREMRRVCRPDGRVLLLEHGRSTVPWVNWLLDRLAPWHLRRYACHLTRDVAALPAEAGLDVVSSERHALGIVVLLEALPGGAGIGEAR